MILYIWRNYGKLSDTIPISVALKASEKKGVKLKVYLYDFLFFSPTPNRRSFFRAVKTIFISFSISLGKQKKRNEREKKL